MPTVKLSPRDVQSRLADSQASTIYLEPNELDEPGALELMNNDVPMVAERDYVRLKWAVRRATDDEVAQHRAFGQAAAGRAPGGTSAQGRSASTETQPIGTNPSTPGASSPVAGVQHETNVHETPDPDETDEKSAHHARTKT